MIKFIHNSIRNTVFVVLSLLLFTCNINNNDELEFPSLPGSFVDASANMDVLKFVGKDSLFVFGEGQMEGPPNVSYILNTKTFLHLSFPIWNSRPCVDLQNGVALAATGFSFAVISNGQLIATIDSSWDASLNEKGNGIAFIRDSSVFIYSVITNQTNRLYSAKQNHTIFRPYWRGEFVYFAMESTVVVSHTYKISVSGGEPEKITFGPLGGYRVRISGQYLMYQTIARANTIADLVITKNGSEVYRYSGHFWEPEIQDDTLYYYGKCKQTGNDAIVKFGFVSAN